jgi:hypothetical protein
MAATWNVTTMNRWGTAMGEEFVAKGDVLTQGKIRSSCPNVDACRRQCPTRACRMPGPCASEWAQL